MVILREGICPGATTHLIQALKEQNVKTVVNLVTADIEDLAQKCSISYKTLMAVRCVLLAQYSPFPSNGADLYEELLGTTAILSTGIPSLDKLLDTGLYTGELTEFVGGPGSGKTQVCLGLATSIACELKQKVLYIDTTGGLSGCRLLQLIQSQADRMEEQSEALQRIEVIRVFEVHWLLDVLQELRASCMRQVAGAHSSLKAIVVDSITAVLSPILGGHQIEGMALMMQLARELKTLARELAIAVIVTNYLVRDTGGGMKPALGCSWSYVPNVRVLLQRGSDSAGPAGGSATILKSSRQPTRLSVGFDITSLGTLGSRAEPSQPFTGDLP
ncbi:DNA repair protein RAD51 homolog 4 isoform X1 [Hypanus sabinus]|uniref:DNA repair protein RAD51 homolog 4 isoform X1 n=1 Tax=Hypanus sabinus TaxID=79690 RepID=UPI0028C4E227|nr:DNA repair protein RAD51 homolog 4 isoform X1 [Hypanus sabinus]